MNNNIGIVIQARAGSSRLPGKMLLPFFNGKSILALIIEELCYTFDVDKIVLATSTLEQDDPVENIGKELGIHTFRGDEANVLKRFTEATDTYHFDTVIRVCADNPFISAKYIQPLIDKYQSNPVDYISYQFPDGTPTILSHVGLFTELVKVDALKKVQELTNDKLYLEHVTNYVYQHPETFNVDFIKVPTFVEDKNNIRLTLDTKEDFDILSKLYIKYVNEFNKTPELLVNYISNTEELLQKMGQEIINNTK